MRSRSTSSARIPNSIPRPMRWCACRPGGCASCSPNIMRRKAGTIRSAWSFRAAAMCRPMRTCLPNGRRRITADAASASAGDAGCGNADPVDRLDKPPSLKPGVGIGQVRLLWGALAFVAVAARRGRLSHHPARVHVGDDRSRRAQEAPMQTAAIADRSPSEALPTIRVLAESNDAGDAARRCRVQGGVLRLRYAGPDRQRSCRSASTSGPIP